MSPHRRGDGGSLSGEAWALHVGVDEGVGIRVSPGGASLAFRDLAFCATACFGVGGRTEAGDVCVMLLGTADSVRIGLGSIGDGNVG